MFDYDDMWLGPKPKRKKRRSVASPRKRVVRKQPTFKQVSKGVKSTYKGAKATYQYAKRGYVGSAEEEYRKRQAKFKKAQKESEYRKKLQEEYGVKSGKEKTKGFFGRFKKKKSIYK